MEFEERLAVTTPEDVEMTLTLAGLGARFLAAAIDLAVQSVIADILVTIVVLLTAASIGSSDTSSGGSAGSGGLILATALAALTLPVYGIACEMLWKGQTPGKMALGLHVVGAGGGPPTLSESMRRNVLRFVDILPAAYALGMLSIVATPRNQRLGDLVAGTLVVRKRAHVAPGLGLFSVKPRVPGSLDNWDTSTIAVQDDLLVRRFLEKRGALTPEARSATAMRLAARYRPMVGGAGAGEDDESFLEGLVCAKSLRSIYENEVNMGLRAPAGTAQTARTAPYGAAPAAAWAAPPAVAPGAPRPGWG